jgi:pimeloyl-ACP methyl ester carboxylesterase
MLKTILWSIGLVAAGFVALCALLYLRQRSMLYYPTPAVGTGEAQPLYLENGRERLKIWQVSAGGDRALLYFGGNAEDVALNLEQFKRLFPGYSIFLMNYRGYGGSSGSPSETGLFSDGLALFDHVRKRYTDISVMGRSLGTGIAVYLAAERPARRLVLVTPFDSMVRLAKTYYPFVPVNLLLKDRYDSVSRAAELEAEILVIIAEHDEVIPRQSSEALVRALPAERTQVDIVPGSGHNTIGSFPQYEKLLQAFLDPDAAP